MDYKLQAVPVKVKEVFEVRELKYLSSQMKQSLIERTVANIRGLAKHKSNGHKIGWLKFKSEVRSIPLKQYGNTYKLLDTKYIKIQGIKQKLRVNGLAQLPEGVDIANATLLQKHGDYYVAITTYHPKQQVTPPLKAVGIDFGLKNQLTLSDGIVIQYSIPVSAQLRKLHKKLSQQQLHSKNWHKTRIKLERAYAKCNHIKQDIRNKLVSHLKDSYRIVCYQDETMKAWQRLWGGKILSTSLGGIIRTLKTKVHTPVEVDRFFPSTQLCAHCGNLQALGLDERIYDCRQCKKLKDRDHNSSINLLNEGLTHLGMVRTEVTPVEIESSTLTSLEYLNSIPYVKASSICESGSLIALA